MTLPDRWYIGGPAKIHNPYVSVLYIFCEVKFKFITTLGVVINDKLTAPDHVSSCSSSLYAVTVDVNICTSCRMNLSTCEKFIITRSEETNSFNIEQSWIVLCVVCYACRLLLKLYFVIIWSKDIIIVIIIIIHLLKDVYLPLSYSHRLRAHWRKLMKNTDEYHQQILMLIEHSWQLQANCRLLSVACDEMHARIASLSLKLSRCSNRWWATQSKTPTNSVLFTVQRHLLCVGSCC